MISIGSHAFDTLTGLSGNLVLPEGLRTIGKQAFDGCSGFTGELVIPESITEIADSAFGGCSGFDGKLKLSRKISTIGCSAFEGCEGFVGDIIIPRSVEKIDGHAFRGIKGISSVTVLNPKCEWNMSYGSTIDCDQICGYEGSTAQAYAEGYNKKFSVFECEHTWDNYYTVDQALTCTEDGSESIHCSVCDEIKENSEKVLLAVKHNWDDGEITTEATCTEDGSKYHQCSRCDEKLDITEIKATGHKWNTYYTIDVEPGLWTWGGGKVSTVLCVTKYRKNQKWQSRILFLLQPALGNRIPKAGGISILITHMQRMRFLPLMV